MTPPLNDTETPQGTSMPPPAHPAAAADGARTYRGRSFAELVPQIEADLGADAIVLSRRSGLSGGVAGFFQTPFVEVEARRGHPGIDLLDGAPAAPEDVRERFPELAVATPSARTGGYAPTGPAGTAERQAGDAFARALADAAAADPFAAEAEALGATADPIGVTADPIGPTGDPVRAAAGPALADASGDVDDALSAPYAPPHAPHAGDAPEQPGGAAEDVSLPAARPLAGELAAPARTRAQAAVEAKLASRGVEQDLIDELIAAAVAHELPLMPARTPLAAAVGAVLRRRIPNAPPLPAQGATVALVGPGGAGKTSCCAALLRAYARRGGAQASCATIAEDGGRPVLLLWPELSKPTPLGDARASRAMARARACGLLLVDMPAISPGEPGSIRTLAALLRRLEVDRVVLALPATWGSAATAQLLEAARPLGASSLALTHADATDQLGAAVQAACRFGLAPEFIFERRRGGSLTRTDPCDLAGQLLA